MKVTIHPEDTGLDNYSKPRECPIAKALIRMGYTEVGVLVTRLHYKDGFGKVIWKDIPRDIDLKAKIWGSKIPIKSPITFEL